MKTGGLESSVINLREFNNLFQKRHDFDSEDVEVLQDNFPHVSFKNIPEAWIILVDKMLSKVGSDVTKVEQHCGLLCVSEREPGLLDLSIVGRYEKMLYKIDEDLHDKLNIL